MSKIVVSSFDSQSQAESAVHKLRRQGFDREISIVAKDEIARTEGNDHATDQGVGIKMSQESPETDSLNNGATTGIALGSIAGLAAGLGAIAIPGLGALFAAGPIAGILSGAATGGIAGGLIDWGIPEHKSQQIEEDVRQGRIVVTVQTDDRKAQEAASILKDLGGSSVSIH